MPRLHTYRYKDKLYTEELQRNRAIKLFCAECIGWTNAYDVEECTAPHCPLYVFRGFAIAPRDPGKASGGTGSA
jgi:hypothetical protein